MGQEIRRVEFSHSDFAEYLRRLAAETREVLSLFDHAGKIDERYVFGFELEAWIVDHNYYPAPHNEEYLNRLSHPLVVPELSRFNVELNATPSLIADNALSRMQAELTSTWQDCQRVCHDMGDALVLIGILPTIRNSDLCLANISPLNRYHALNEQILKCRQGKALTIDIDGRDSLRLVHDDVMLEAATTSFQVHFQVPFTELQRHYNASHIVAGPIIAVAANSPFLFGRSLWEETRVPLFEQAVDIGGDTFDTPLHRVTFGSGYLTGGVSQYFEENLKHFQPLLPILFDGATRFEHMRLHNGTIWRWNRLLIGFDDEERPHVRIEHRPLPAGPSLVDMMANAALYLGATHFLAKLRDAPENDLPFAAARANFYTAAKLGLDAELVWLGGQSVNVESLLLDELIPMAKCGLESLGVASEESERYLSIISSRVKSGQNGASWQRTFVDRHGKDMLQLTAAYLENQRSGAPVHEWEI
ncbi:MAG: glutamate-cysteine ligase family protein [Gammaproteobacteria bacterium]